MFPFVRKPRDAGKMWPGLQQMLLSPLPTELKLALDTTLIYGQRRQMNKTKARQAEGDQRYLVWEAPCLMHTNACIPAYVCMSGAKTCQADPTSAPYIPICLPEYLM